MDAGTVSIILPVLNESEVDKKIDLLLPFINGYAHEIIVVDDSSDDRFLSLKKILASREDVRLIKGPHKGKGAAIRQAVLESKGSIVFYIDADFRIPLDNISRFIDLISKQGNDLVIAERPFNKTPRSLLRLICSLALFSLVRVFVFCSTFFYDTQCGFKAFKGEVIRHLAKKQSINGGMFDIEFLYMARYNKLRIAKVPVFPLPEIRRSKINLWRCLRGDVFDLLSVKLKGLLGYYKISDD